MNVLALILALLAGGATCWRGDGFLYCETVETVCRAGECEQSFTLFAFPLPAPPPVGPPPSRPKLPRR